MIYNSARVISLRESLLPARVFSGLEQSVVTFSQNVGLNFVVMIGWFSFVFTKFS